MQETEDVIRMVERLMDHRDDTLAVLKAIARREEALAAFERLPLRAKVRSSQCLVCGV